MNPEQIQRILEYSNGEYSLDDILRMELEGTLHFLKVGSLDLAVTVEEYPQKRVLFIQLLIGDNIEADMWELRDVLSVLAKSWNCTEIQCKGRPGWERMLAPLGAKKIYTVMSLEVICPEAGVRQVARKRKSQKS